MNATPADIQFTAYLAWCGTATGQRHVARDLPQPVSELERRWVAMVEQGRPGLFVRSLRADTERINDRRAA